MIRIIYSWNVEPEKLELFIETWKRTTNIIHEEVEGARGSFMIQNSENDTEIKTIARWDSLEDWEKFWKVSSQKHMGGMHELGHRVSVDIFKEIDDYTK